MLLEIIVGKLIDRAIDFAGTKIRASKVLAALPNNAKQIGKRVIEEKRLVLARKIASEEEIAIETILGEFKQIFANKVFRNFMKNEWNRFDEDICVPITRKLHMYDNIADNRFYALPAFILSIIFFEHIRQKLSAAKGLDDLYRRVFGKILTTEKRENFIHLSSKLGAEIAINDLIDESRPNMSGWWFKTLNIKSLSNKVYFWCYNPDFPWHPDYPLGHFYVEKRENPPNADELEDIEALRNQLDGHLLGVGAQIISLTMLEELDQRLRISQKTRESISISRQ